MVVIAVGALVCGLGCTVLLGIDKNYVDVAGIDGAVSELTVKLTPNPLRIRINTSGDLTVEALRPLGYTEPLDIQLAGLPPGAGAPTSRIAEGAGTASVRVNLGLAVPAGEYPVTVKLRGASREASGQLTLVAMPPPGTLDTEFGGGRDLDGGITGIPVDFATDDMVVLPSGKILLSGTTSADEVAMLRLTDKGALDATYGAQGIAKHKFGNSSAARGLVVMPSGEAYVGADVNAPGPHIAVAHFDANGVFDAKYGDAAPFQLNSTTTNAGGITVQNGLIIGVAAVSCTDTDCDWNDFALYRLDATGKVDATFGSSSGYTRIVNPSANRTIEGLRVVVDSNGRLVTAGVRQNDNGGREVTLMRFIDAGKELTFDPVPLPPLAAAELSFADALRVQADGTILVSGAWKGAKDAADSFVARYLTSGAADATFGSKGAYLNSFGDGNESIVAIEPDSQGKIFFGARLGAINDQKTASAIGRLTKDGALDVSFGDKGKVTIASLGTTGFIVRALAVMGDDKVLVAGRTRPSAGNAAPFVIKLWQ